MHTNCIQKNNKCNEYLETQQKGDNRKRVAPPKEERENV